MSYYYAQITKDGICCSVVNTYGEINRPDMIQLASFDESLLGKRWTGTTWQNVESQNK